MPERWASRPEAYGGAHAAMLEMVEEGRTPHELAEVIVMFASAGARYVDNEEP